MFDLGIDNILEDERYVGFYSDVERPARWLWFVGEEGPAHLFLLANIDTPPFTVWE